MYNDHDRPTTQRMLITAALWVAGIAAVIGIAAVVFGIATSRSETPVSKPLATAGVQAPATATASVTSVAPAPQAKVTTAQVSASSLVAATSSEETTKAAATKTTPAVETGLGTVVIDAGHQGKGDNSLEPIGPGSSTKKPKVASGTSGVATHVDESVINLRVALKLQAALESRGVKVVMVRTRQSVNIANSERAKIANRANAALMVRLHCDSAASSVTGILTETPAKSWYPDHPIVDSSAKAAGYIQKAMLLETGANDRGTRKVGDQTGLNWLQVPGVIIEMGLMSNPAEDRKLDTAAYQQKLADGMASGIVAYLKNK